MSGRKTSKMEYMTIRQMLNTFPNTNIKERLIDYRWSIYLIFYFLVALQFDLSALSYEQT